MSPGPRSQTQNLELERETTASDYQSLKLSIGQLAYLVPAFTKELPRCSPNRPQVLSLGHHEPQLVVLGFCFIPPTLPGDGILSLLLAGRFLTTP